MSANPGQVYRLLISTTTPIAPSVQEHIFEWAKAAKDYDLMARLLGLSDLSDDLDAKIGKVPNYVVQTAWVSRAGRDLGVLSAKAQKDTRVAVLSSLATAKGLSPEAYDALSKSSSRTVAFELVENDGASLEQRERAMGTLATSMWSASYDESRKYGRIFDAHPELITAAISSVAAQEGGEAKHGDVHKLAEIIFSSPAEVTLEDLSLDDADKLIQIVSGELVSLFQILQNLTATNSYLPYELTSSTRRYLGYLTQAAMLECMSQARRTEVLDFVTKNFSSGVGGGQLTNDVTRLLAMLGQTPKSVHESSPAKVAAEKSVEVLAKLAADFDPAAPNARDVATAIIANRKSDLNVVRTVLSRLPNFSLDYRTLLNARIKDLDVVVELCRRGQYALDDDALAKAPSPSEIIKALLSADEGRFANEVVTSRFMNDELVGMLPVSFIGQMTRASDKTKATIMGRIAASLGDDKRAWEMFDDAVVHAPGTIDHLLEHIRVLMHITGHDDK